MAPEVNELLVEEPGELQLQGRVVAHLAGQNHALPHRGVQRGRLRGDETRLWNTHSRWFRKITRRQWRRMRRRACSCNDCRQFWSRLSQSPSQQKLSPLWRQTCSSFHLHHTSVRTETLFSECAARCSLLGVLWYCSVAALSRRTKFTTANDPLDRQRFMQNEQSSFNILICSLSASKKNAGRFQTYTVKSEASDQSTKIL